MTSSQCHRVRTSEEAEAMFESSDELLLASKLATSLQRALDAPSPLSPILVCLALAASSN